ncbi:hydrolytic protein [Streptomyces luomodiensis]|uniref:Hydrolytic protein n=1 Tax=Streptomyces luomodiensis TaxID=3026192 RepID=A0ABY9V885_9ACTN|nr:hydrolytic protein [Streptomyces sp. SCA4-21]WNF01120.1 hydrolytic protein [Streptomyces sp. SCA4-21]
MTPSAASSGAGAPGLEIPAVTVAPGGTATTTLTVRNDSDIVEAYDLEAVGDCAPWTTVEPARVSLYPGTSETVTLRLEPPRSPEIGAGAVPLGVRVLPNQHPESVRVPETTVHIEEFHELRTELAPRRRRGWLRGRYRLAVRNQGNTPVRVGFTPGQAGEELGFAFSPTGPKLEPGESTEVRLRVRTGKPVWFGAPVVWPFTVHTTETGDQDAARREEARRDAAPPAVQAPLDAEFVQIPVFSKWLLAVLAALIALVLAWFALVRPAVRSAAEKAANKTVQSRPGLGDQGGQSPGAGAGDGAPTQPGGQETGGQNGQPEPGGSGPGASSGSGGGTGRTAGVEQSSRTIDVRTAAGAKKTGTYRVPEDTAFGITDIVVANFQGDEGVMTITFGNRKITTIALETFRNQDYHWVTPIQIAENDTVTVEVTCDKPGIPATGRRARECHEVLNVSGELSRTKR